VTTFSIDVIGYNILEVNNSNNTLNKNEYNNIDVNKNNSN